MYTMIEMLVDGHGMTAQVIHALPECLIGGRPCRCAVWSLPSKKRVAVCLMIKEILLFSGKQQLFN